MQEARVALQDEAQRLGRGDPPPREDGGGEQVDFVPARQLLHRRESMAVLFQIMPAVISSRTSGPRGPRLVADLDTRRPGAACLLHPRLVLPVHEAELVPAATGSPATLREGDADAGEHRVLLPRAARRRGSRRRRPTLYASTRGTNPSARRRDGPRDPARAGPSPGAGRTPRPRPGTRRSAGNAPRREPSASRCAGERLALREVRATPAERRASTPPGGT